MLQLEALLLQHPEGLTQADIARRLGVNRSTIYRYLPGLPGHIYIDDTDNNKLKIDRSAYLVNVRFNLNEAMAIHLATRLLASTINEHNSHAAAALRKLAISMKRLAPHISDHMSESADQMDDISRKRSNDFIKVLETLTLAWANGKKTKIFHRYRESGEVYEYMFSPYFIEPYAAGHSIHAIGLSKSLKGEEKIRTFKIERIVRVKITNECYQIPESFNPYDLMEDAWGIWYTMKKPVKVTLKFSTRVSARVRATCWHQSQVLSNQTDGTLIWEGSIAEPKEMQPWIRGWGADCEVLTPENLRQEMKSEAAKLFQVYKLGGE